MKAWCRKTWAAGLNLCYPALCPGCEVPVESDDAHDQDSHEGGGHGLCAACHDRLWPCVPPCCQVCGEPFQPEGSADFTCQTCQGRRFAFHFATAAYQSRDVLRELIHRFKYNGHITLGPTLGKLMRRALDDPRLGSLESWLAVPVPLHPRRYREREFNQSEELCRALRKVAGLRYLRGLRRIRYTSSQTQFRREQRMENLRGAFQVREPTAAALDGRRILLVDDVFTTGSTAHECAAVLRREGGAEKVVVITLARG